MPDYTVRLATKPEIKDVAEWFLQERAKDPRFVRLTRNALQRYLYTKLVTPRYLTSQAHTFVLEQDSRQAGFAVVEQRDNAVTLADFLLRPGVDEAPMLRVLLDTTEQLARERDYPIVRIAPLESSEARLNFFRSQGYELLDYYLWSFEGEAARTEPPVGLVLQPLAPKQALERRIHFLRQEMEASHVAAQHVIETTLFPRQPPAFRSFSIELAEPGGQEEAEIGYLSPRPNERNDGVLTVAISLLPEYWGTELEGQIVGGMASEIGRGQAAPLRVLISTSAHADRAEAIFQGMGLARVMDYRPILYKELTPAPAARS